MCVSISNTSLVQYGNKKTLEILESPRLNHSLIKNIYLAAANLLLTASQSTRFQKEEI
jgi:hypothetical protein